MNVDMWKDKLRKLPLVAILRGISLDEVQPVAEVLYHSGFRALEIPLNSKRAVESIGLCVSEFGTDMLVGAGTVLDVEEVKKVEQVGCQFAVSPNVDASVIKATKKTKMISVPGVSTPSEAFMAERRLLCSQASVLSESCVVLRLPGCEDARWAAFTDAGFDG